MNKKFKNGQKVMDKLSGLTGTITAEVEYLNGCIRYQIQPGLDKEGHYQEVQVIDEQQLEIIESPVMKEPKRNGGDRPGLPKYHL